MGLLIVTYSSQLRSGQAPAWASCLTQEKHLTTPHTSCATSLHEPRFYTYI